MPENSSILKSIVHCTDNNIIIFHTKFQLLNVNSKLEICAATLCNI